MSVMTTSNPKITQDPQLKKPSDQKQAIFWKQVWWILKQEMMIKTIRPTKKFPIVSQALSQQVYGLLENILGLLLLSSWFLIWILATTDPKITQPDYQMIQIFFPIFDFLFLLFITGSYVTFAKVFFENCYHIHRISSLYRTLPLATKTIATSRIIQFIVYSLVKLLFLFSMLFLISNFEKSTFPPFTVGDYALLTLFWFGYNLLFSIRHFMSVTFVRKRYLDAVPKRLTNLLLFLLIYIPLYFLLDIDQTANIISWSLALVQHHQWIAYLSPLFGFIACYGWYRLLRYRLSTMDYE